MRKKIILVFFGVLVLAYIFTRVAHLQMGLTVDEPNWIFRSTGFLHALRGGHFENTYLSPHPGVTTMIAGSIGQLIHKVMTTFFDLAHISYSYNLLLIFFSRLGVVLVQTIFIVCLLYIIAIRYKNKVWASMTAVLIVFEPYITALSRIIHVDTLVSLPMVLAVLYWDLSQREGKSKDVLMAGVFTGLSFLTKTPSALLIFFFLLTGFVYVRSIKQLKLFFIHFAFVIMFSGLVSMLLWPKLWAEPIHAMFNLLNVTNPGINKLHRLAEADILFYIKSVLTYMHPITIGLSVGSLIYAIIKLGNKKILQQRIVLFHLFTFSFILAMTLITKKSERYIMPSYIMMTVTGGFMLAELYRFQKLIGGVIVAMIVGMYLAIIVSIHPYYLSYYNPIMKTFALERVGLGEGLDQAAIFLNDTLPNPYEETIVTWYDSTTDYYFVGQAKDYDSCYADVHYVITYRNMYGRGEDEIATKVLRYFADMEPYHTVIINGISYAWIYEVPYYCPDLQ